MVACVISTIYEVLTKSERCKIHSKFGHSSLLHRQQAVFNVKRLISMITKHIRTYDSNGDACQIFHIIYSRAIANELPCRQKNVKSDSNAAVAGL